MLLVTSIIINYFLVVSSGSSGRIKNFIVVIAIMAVDVTSTYLITYYRSYANNK